MIATQYANRQSYEAYVTYLALKRHFTTPSYDFFRYNGKVNASYEKFKLRRDVYSFAKVGEHRAPKDLILANIIANPNAWIGDIASEPGHQKYLDWKKRIDALSHHFKGELNRLDPDYRKNFEVVDGQHPHLLKLYLQKTISLETFTLLFGFAKVKEYWEKEIADPVVAPEAIHKAAKYRLFIEADEKKLREYVREALLPC